MTAPIHLKPTAALAERVLLPGDPGRALMLAQSLLRRPRMFNHHRGLWGYTGMAADGSPLTIQSTGMGGPSAAIVISELANLGAVRMLRVGTCGALSAELRVGELLIATEAIAADGASRGLARSERVHPTPDLLDALVAAAEGDGPAATAAPVASTDLVYDSPNDQESAWIAAGGVAVDMETATLFALAARRGLQAASLLAVSGQLLPSRVRIEEGQLREAEERMGRLAVAAMTLAGNRR